MFMDTHQPQDNKPETFQKQNEDTEVAMSDAEFQSMLRKALSVPKPVVQASMAAEKAEKATRKVSHNK